MCKYNNFRELFFFETFAMGNALGCCADQSAVVTDKGSPTGGIAKKKTMFGKKHEETESSEEDQSVEGKPISL